LITPGKRARPDPPEGENAIKKGLEPEKHGNHVMRVGDAASGSRTD
jgi:hypothetical protein